MLDQELRLFKSSKVLLKRYPYYYPAVNAIRLVRDDSTEYMAVDADWNMYYNPNTISKFSDKELDGVYYHELSHLLRDHFIRSHNYFEWKGITPTEKEYYTFNIANDMEINPDILDAKFELPSFRVMPSKYGLSPNLTSEEYYEFLRKSPMFRKVGQGIKGLGDMRTSKDPTSQKSRNKSKAVVEAVKSAKEAHDKLAGVGSGNSFKNVKLYDTRMSWKKIIKARLSRLRQTKFGYKDVTYSKLSRRSSSNTGVVYPKWFAYEHGDIYIIIDTSGSMANVMNDVYSQVKKILKEFPEFQISIIEVDWDIQCVHTDLKKPLEVSTDHGGTDMTVGLQYLLDNKIDPEFILVLTDGFTPWKMTPQPFLRKTVVGFVERDVNASPPSSPYKEVEVLIN